MKILIIFLSLLLMSNIISLFAQSNNALNFWPHHVGDIWQYSSAANEVIRTAYIDSTYIDSISKEIFIWGRNVAGSINYTRNKIDSLGNFYNLNYNSNYVRYKLYADSGDTWIIGYQNDTIPVTGTVLNVYNDVIFGISTKVKIIRFEIQYPSPQNPFSLGDDYLAEGFGLVRSDIEGGGIYYLTGALIDGVKYGVITSIEDDKSVPKSFDIIKNYPNPFNNSTIIAYSIANEGNVNISVYDLLGRKIKKIIDEKKEKGSYKIRFNADDLTSGIYFLMLKTNSKILTHKIILLK